MLLTLLFTLTISWVKSDNICDDNLRKEWRELTRQEKTNFIRALQILKDSGDIDRFTRIHWNYQYYIHGTPQFFPWHRKFLIEFEILLQRINPNISIPYWDWSIDSQAPEEVSCHFYY